MVCLYLKGELASLNVANVEYERVDYRCEASSESDPLGLGGMAYDLPTRLLSTLNTAQLASGITLLKIKGATIYWDQATESRTLDVDADATIEVVDDADTSSLESNNRRLTIRTQGTSTMLMVLVRSADSVNSLTDTTVAERMFNMTTVSVASQYQACSAGKMNFVPATYVNRTTGDTVTMGVGELTIGANVKGSVMTFEFEQQLQAAFPGAFGDFQNYDHVLYCMPAGMSSQWIGYTYGRYVMYCIIGVVVEDGDTIENCSQGKTRIG